MGWNLVWPIENFIVLTLVDISNFIVLALP